MRRSSSHYRPSPRARRALCAAPARQGYERRLVTGGAVDRRAPLQLPRLARLCVRGGRGQPGAARGQARGRGVDARGERHHAADRGPAAQLRRPGGRRQAGGAGKVVGPADVGLAGEAGGSHRVKDRSAPACGARQLALTHIANTHQETSPGQRTLHAHAMYTAKYRRTTSRCAARMVAGVNNTSRDHGAVGACCG